MPASASQHQVLEPPYWANVEPAGRDLTEMRLLGDILRCIDMPTGLCQGHALIRLDARDGHKMPYQGIPDLSQAQVGNKKLKIRSKMHRVVFLHCSSS